jgi:catechol 2,3-dioxygenase-like lactoylglutathione lyase family enzyme
MKTTMTVPAIAMMLICAAALGQAQPAAPAAPPVPTGLVVGSANFFSPIVADLEKAVAFYRDGVGFDVEGAPANADAIPDLRAMFGLPDARLQWQVGRAPGIAGGVEIVEVSKAGGAPLERRIQDSGAVMLIVLVRDIDATFARVQKYGARVVTRGGAPVTVGTGVQKARVVILQDPDGHFVELVQNETPPATQAPANANVIGIRVRVTVDDVERSLRLYRDALGLQAGADTPAYGNDPGVLTALGLSNAQYRFGRVVVPTSGLEIQLIDFKGVDRRSVRGGIEDPGSTRMQLLVSDIDAAVAAIGDAGGTFVSTGGKPLKLNAGNASLEVGIVRDPDNLFLVLIETPSP